MKRAIAAKANAALDNQDPRKALEQMILELEENVLEAKKELLSFKATEKRLNGEIERVEEKIATWDKRARAAVEAGKDDLAKEALRERQRCEAEKIELVRDRNEAATYALEINRGRKQIETKLQILKLKKGTMAQQLAAARSGEAGFGGDDIWRRMEEAEERINDEVATAAASEELGADNAVSRQQLAELEEAARVAEQDAALAALKAKMGDSAKRLADPSDKSRKDD